MKLLVPATINDAALVSSTIAEDDYADWSSGTTYALADRVIRTGTHKIYESLAGGNLANVPETSPLSWIEVSATNRWAMFDNVVGTRSTEAPSIEVVLDLGAINDLVLLDLVADSVTVVSSSGTTTVAVPAPTAPATSVTFSVTDIAHAGGDLTLTISGTGTVEVGNVSIGSFTTIGETQHGSGVGMVDYSRRVVDEFGAVSLTRRGYSRRVNCRVVIPSTDVDRVCSILTALRSVPVVWVGAVGFDSLVVFGYYKEWSCELADYVISNVSISIESLVLDGAAASIDVTVPPAPPGDIAMALADKSITSGPIYGPSFVGPIFPGDSVTATFTLHSDGTASQTYWQFSDDGFGAGGSIVTSIYAGEWAVSSPIDASTAALYECQFGSDAWQSLSADRAVSLTATTFEDLTATTSVRIRNAATGVLLAAAALTLRAYVIA